MPKTVVISGASRGLGAVLADVFLSDTDSNLALCARSRTNYIESLCSDSDSRCRVFFKPVDLANRTEVRSFVRDVKRRFHTVDVLVNNAGVAVEGVLALQSDKSVDLMIDTNLKGTIALTRACVREMLVNHWGRVVTITSIVGKSGFRGLSVYSTTKAGLDGFTRSLARELGDRRITVNSVAPGFIETEMTRMLTPDQKQQIVRRTPAGRLGQAQDVVGIVKFLCSDSAGFITGQTIVVDGGATS